MLTIAIILFAIIFNTIFASKLPLVEGCVLILHCIGLFVIIIPLWVMAPRSNAEVLITFSNNGGWPTTGLSSMIGMVAPLILQTGFDCCVHMCKSSCQAIRDLMLTTILNRSAEEVRDASITIPKAIMWSVVINASLGFIAVITLIFTLGDINSLLASPTRQPFIQVFFNATNSYAATNVMTSVIIILQVSATISCIATSSRQIWSFSRDRGFPFSNWLSKVLLSLPL